MKELVKPENLTFLQADVFALQPSTLFIHCQVIRMLSLEQILTSQDSDHWLVTVLNANIAHFVAAFGSITQVKGASASDMEWL